MREVEGKAKFFALVERYIKLGQLLDEEKIEDGDIEAISEARLILAEMAKTKAELDALISQWLVRRRENDRAVFRLRNAVKRQLQGRTDRDRHAGAGF